MKPFRRNPSRPLVIIVLMMLVLLATPVRAQESTAQSTPPASEAAPLASKEAVAPVAVDMESGSGDLTINTNAGPATPAISTDPANSVPAPVVIVAAVVVGLVFLGFLYNQHLIIKAVAPLAPPESTQGLIDAVLPALTSLVLNTVGTAIPGDIDDRLFIEAARQRGLIVVRGNDGLYHTTRATPVTPEGTSPVNLPLPGATTVHPDAG